MTRIESNPNPTRCPRTTRTVLAVPGHRMKMLESAAACAADAVFIDLEDAVPLDKKGEALRTAVRALAELEWGDKTVAVRINANERGIDEHEVRTLTGEARRLDSILVPKVESADAIAQTERLLAARPASFAPLEIEALIETARGIVNVDSIAGSSERLTALHFGVGDFSASIGARNVEIGGTHPGYAVTLKDQTDNYAATPLDLWTYPMMRILVAARAFGLRAIDGPCGAFRDPVLTRAWALKAAAMGYDGKQVIHPGQIEPTRTAFSPTDDEVHDARRTVAALEAAQAAGLAAISLDGKLVDFANVRMAERIIAMAERD
ncbi:L-malyl-CoA/beta-methylmalyl-CoA lyase [Paraburkholderia aspalathi]|uniref:L-malyl-CoA/beta-methylmalyl-CoA lyase n=1 Tax=Paraburkholderia aspalathi TaxID=1324617 RepID=A0ABM8T829_9BURK|nr:CoA ester lyase [Paraburkholderia aspalathi]MBK3824160.1 CoA ester lyase [Paraburkholderia aspalathi]MBK3836000.1 CoA ester lyase [Paraburkholderia aspalathi]MBK3844105.1 CoA ester lyase [Paraburkholderia aspalathi]MBK3865775.1 CoA ester lyase [Paraburkholderia aspalathi]CAE6866859.1 L-malyl-CoA/beta-methylmalyl-CoA lyase [Paraburkholderia aspalathi]